MEADEVNRAEVGLDLLSQAHCSPVGGSMSQVLSRVHRGDARENKVLAFSVQLLSKLLMQEVRKWNTVP
jgi:hypothetical protein